MPCFFQYPRGIVESLENMSLSSVYMVKVLDYYPLTADFCMAPNLLSEVDLTWRVPKYNHQLWFLY